MYITRTNQAMIFASFERKFISALLGPRRVGKSTMVKHYIRTHPDRKWAVLNMDKQSERMRVEKGELNLLIEENVLVRIGTDYKIWVVIDEAQKCPALFDQIKLIYDNFKDQDLIKFILTGSAHLNLHQLTAESLGGRVDLLHLREFNLREVTCFYHRETHIPIDKTFSNIFNFNIKQLTELFYSLRPFGKILNQSLNTYLLWGGLPEVIEENEDTYKLKYLSNYLQTYLEKDIRSIDTIDDLSLYHNLMRICAEQTGSLRDDKKIIDALHCSRNTINKYRNYLQATLQYIDIYSYVDSSIKRLVKSPKGYLTNNGLISYLTGIHHYPTLELTGLIGHRFENWFLNELQTWQDCVPENNMNYFWRTTTNLEVDFISLKGSEVVPFEITHGSQINKRKVKHLISFLEIEPKAKFGCYVYMGDLHFDEVNKILFIPAWML